ncbi:MAG: cellobiose phosphorylase [Candidatus Omnitrophica bacterium]|nr:cellobiose phosphorylase [Candidatus Omnitrophota bacterium]MBU1997527.1 cellobiose phosphorylase [Candidatus Omnitrophota bacterium]MBU4334888.1 cellobiose phosphorylase [Candidatus Omnitrophota bacterium]
MNLENDLYEYLPDGISFKSKKATQLKTIYMPLSGPSAQNIKSSITPGLSGDIKIDKSQYLTMPASTQDLRKDLRNFFVHVEGKGVVSIAKETSRDSSTVEIGQLWHKLTRSHKDIGIEIEALNFIPSSGENVELMRVTVKNISKEKVTIVPTASIPLFARSLANKHDHEHVTSLLNRIRQFDQGVVVEPTMMFNEEGHKPCDNVYYVFGETGKSLPAGTFPTIDSFLGDHSTLSDPSAVINNEPPRKLSDEQMHGKEAAGALRFDKVTLAEDESRTYIIVAGIAGSGAQAILDFEKFNTVEKFDAALYECKEFWSQITNSIIFETGAPDFNSWMHWVTIQPVLRRIFGCSFLPDHDYGKGGKGWRDIWQDLLSLILIEPENVRSTLIDNFAGVRIDGSNATIIGARPGEFIADRNAITRVWMDHGVWPFTTILLYINQTGDFDILLEKNAYFKDVQLSRSFNKDHKWATESGNKLRDRKGKIYTGTIIEHILLQNLVQFFNVGEHNISRLESADWNDGLDMAFDKGESVAFMSFYAGNLNDIADMLEELSRVKGIDKLSLASELKILLDSLSKDKRDYGSVHYKKDLLFSKYFKAVEPRVSGKVVEVSIKDIVSDLKKKSKWAFDFIRKNELIKIEHEEKSYSWVNGYYDNAAKRVEGLKDGKVRMTLTGQVFPVMSGLTNEEETLDIIKSVNEFLVDKKLGGVRLNTDFGEKNYLDLGRAFGFAYGTKENGAFFSHMIVMYAYALYKRGFSKEGHQVLRSIFKMSQDTEKSKIYPGICEYFDSEGRGMYHYLTGAASWLVLAHLTQVFGVRGLWGDLALDPKLVSEEFNANGIAQVSCCFAGKRVKVTYINHNKLDHGKYRIAKVTLNGKNVEHRSSGAGLVFVDRELISKEEGEIEVEVVLDK